jgi:putative transposase
MDRQKTLKAVLHYFFQDNTRSGYHSKYNLKYHIVWIPKYRRSLLVGALAVRLSEILYKAADEYGFKIVAHEIMPDHIHMLVEAPPKISPMYIVAVFKKRSSTILRKEFLDYIEKYIWKENTLWATGYYISTVGDGITAKIVEEYINNQKSAG